jgi:hypothetical protein
MDARDKDKHAIDTTFEDKTIPPQIGVNGQAALDHDDVRARLAGRQLDTLKNLSKPRVADVGDHEPDGLGLAGSQTARDAVWPTSQIAGNLQDTITSFGLGRFALIAAQQYTVEGSTPAWRATSLSTAARCVSS